MRFKQDSPIYAFTTENLGGYFPLIDFSGKNVLTVTASGDHVINALMLGAKSVRSFDVNSRANHFAELKLSALERLDFEGFKEFFLRGNDALGFEIYKLLRRGLSQEAAAFFDEQYDQFNGDGRKLRESDLFNNKYDKTALKLASNPYLQSEQDYRTAQTNCARTRPKLLIARADQIPQMLERPVDIVLLSNIADYVHEIFSEDPLVQFRDQVVKPLVDRLIPRGIICAAYVYDAHDIVPFRSSVDNPVERRKLGFEGVEYSESTFDGVIEGRKDLVVMLKINCKEVKHDRTIQTIARA